MAGDLKGKEDEKLPPGFRFHPTDEELITYYLINKINDSNFTERAVADVDLNKCEPWDLPGKAKMGVKEWYFFSLRDRKYPTGVRTNRATNSGYWKTTGKDREIYNSQTSELVGMKKTLVFYRGRAPRGEKTNWVMHEYRIHAKSSYRTTTIAAAAKDEWVVCRVIQKSGGVKKYTSSSSHSRAMNPYNLEIGRQSHSQLMMMQQQQQQQQEADHAYHQLQTMGRNYMMSQSEMEQLSRVFRVGGGTNGLNLPIHNNSQLNYSHHLGNGAEAAAFTISGLNLNLGGGGANMAPPAPIPPPPGINNQHVVGSSMLTSGGIVNEGAGGGGGGGYVPTADQQINNANSMNGRSYEGMIQCADLDAYWTAY